MCAFVVYVFMFVLHVILREKRLEYILVISKRKSLTTLFVLHVILREKRLEYILVISKRK